MNQKTYCCDRCSFLFVRSGEVEQCPLCEGFNIRLATEEEAKKVQEQLKLESEHK
ncbi:MAG: hypothetical protein IJO79_02765 [Firmicutes bacterium]|nr:hypothetical protein [Bacillota bacterium]